MYDEAACVVWMTNIEAMEEISRRLIMVRIFGVWFFVIFGFSLFDAGLVRDNIV